MRNRRVPCDATSCGSLVEMSRPMKLIVPLYLSSKPMIAFRVVDLPAPLRPISATTSPRRTSTSTWNRICAAPYQAARSITSSNGCSAAFVAALMLALLRPPLPSRRSCRSRSRPPAPSGGRESRAACLRRSVARGPGRSCDRRRRRQRPCCAR